MGGYGSGRRQDAKRTTESQHRIDIRWLKRTGLLRAGVVGSISWTCVGKESGQAAFRVKGDRLLLEHPVELTGGRSYHIQEIIPFAWTPCSVGGERQWFLCPGCCRRVAVVYCIGHFRCRHCHDLTYGSQQESRADRLIRRARSIRRRLGGSGNLDDPFPEKPKNMHWNTYRRLQMIEYAANIQSLQPMAERIRLGQ